VPPERRKPAALRPGDAIAVVAPASLPREADRLPRGIAHLESLGYRVEVARAAWHAHGYLAGPDEERLAEFNGFLRRDDLKAIFCVRGGYGTLRLLPLLDYEAARRHPKLLVGYSDITALHLALYHRAGWVGLSGPMVAVEWGVMDEATERLFWDLAQGRLPQPLLGPGGEAPLRPGTAEGILLGGNLSMLVRLIGTPYLPPLDGALLFLEEVGEQPYRLDALFAQLKLAGLLGRLGGLLLGGFTEWEPPDDRPTFTPDEVFDAYLRSAPFPVARGLVYGHFPVKNTLPVGVRARLEVTGAEATLSLLEPAVVMADVGSRIAD
jgi:muramoyltetrapeptide carboxypeptidase